MKKSSKFVQLVFELELPGDSLEVIRSFTHALANLFDAAEGLCDNVGREGDSIEESLQRAGVEEARTCCKAQPDPAVRRALETLTPNRGPYTVCPHTLEILDAKGQVIALPDYSLIRAAHSTVDEPDEVMRRQEDKVRALATILSAAEE